MVDRLKYTEEEADMARRIAFLAATPRAEADDAYQLFLYSQYAGGCREAARRALERLRGERNLGAD